MISIILNSFKEHFFVRKKSFNLCTTFLKDLCHNLGSQLVCRVRKNISDLENYTVEELGILVIPLAYLLSSIATLIESKSKRVLKSVLRLLLVSLELCAHSL